MRQFTRLIGMLEETVAVILLIAMSAIALLQVVGRYILTNPFIWTEELTRLMLIWLTFIAAAAVTRRGMHIAVDTVVDVLKPGFRRFVMTIVHLVMFVTFLWFSYLAMKLAQNVGGLPLAATRWSMSTMVWPAAIGSFLIAFHSLVRAIAVLTGAPDDEASGDAAIRT